MKYNLRVMEEKDIIDVIEGETRVFGTSLGEDFLITDLCLNPFAHYFVLDIDDKVRGYIGIWIRGDNADILNFYVDKEFRSMGYGSMMMRFVVNLCDAQKVRYLSLEVRESNNTAQSFYEKHKFVYSHIRKNYYSNGEDAFVYIREYNFDE